MDGSGEKYCRRHLKIGAVLLVFVGMIFAGAPSHASAIDANATVVAGNDTTNNSSVIEEIDNNTLSSLLSLPEENQDYSASDNQNTTADNDFIINSGNDSGSLSGLVSGNTSTSVADNQSDEDSSIQDQADFTNSTETANNGRLVINEVELNPHGNDVGKEWIELYNPSDTSVNASNYLIKTSYRSMVIELPPDVNVEANGTYLVRLDRQILSNSAEVLTLTDSTGDRVIDRTPSLVDRKDDDRSWQRIPDGNSEWIFDINSKGELNFPNQNANFTIGGDDSSSLNGNSSDMGGTSTTSEGCSAGITECIAGIAIRIVDGDTLYVKDGDKVYKINLALVKTPASYEQGFAEATAFTRDLCLGSNTQIDLDDNQTTPENMLGVAYCSFNNLNEELLINGHAVIDPSQCSVSEFGKSGWAKDAGC